MTPHNPRRLLALFAVAVVTVACGDTTTTEPATTPATSQPVTTAATSTTSSSASTSTTVEATTTTSPLPTGPGAAFTVAGGAPADVVEEQTRIYGTVYDPVTFATEFEVHGLPYPQADGVIVIDHQQSVQPYPPRGTSRWDTISYSFTDPRSAGELIAAVAVATGTELNTVPGSQGCTEGIDPVKMALPDVIVCPADPGTWTMQVLRTLFVPGDVTPPAVVTEHLATHAPVTANGGVINLWDYLRVPDEPGGYSLTIGYTLPAPITIDTLRSWYPDWQTAPDNGYGPGITNGTHHWTLNPDDPTQLTYTTQDPALIG